MKKQNSKGSKSHISVACRARLLKVNDINGYEVLAKDSLDSRSCSKAECRYHKTSTGHLHRKTETFRASSGGAASEAARLPDPNRGSDSNRLGVTGRQWQVESLDFSRRRPTVVILCAPRGHDRTGRSLKAGPGELPQPVIIFRSNARAIISAPKRSSEKIYVLTTKVVTI